MWLVFAIISGIFSTASGLITRHVLRKHSDAWAFSFFFSAIGTLVVLPFFIASPKMPYTFGISWVVMIGIGILIVIQNLLVFTSSKHLVASVQGSLTKFRLVWTLLFGVLLLHESFTALKLLGTGLTILSGLIIIRKFRAPGSLISVIYAISATLLFAIVMVFYKYIFTDFNSQTLTLFVFLIPAVINLFFMPKAKERISLILKSHGRWVIASCVCGGLANLTMNHAVSIGEISKVPVIIESFLIITLVGEHIFLKEKDHLITKLLAVAGATIGAIFIKIA